jgi:hypothetical protein
MEREKLESARSVVVWTDTRILEIRAQWRATAQAVSNLLSVMSSHHYSVSKLIN